MGAVHVSVNRSSGLSRQQSPAVWNEVGFEIPKDREVGFDFRRDPELLAELYFVDCNGGNEKYIITCNEYPPQFSRQHSKAAVVVQKNRESHRFTSCAVLLSNLFKKDGK